MTGEPQMVPIILGSGGPTVCCYPGMKRGPGNAAVTHAFIAGKGKCACGAIGVAPGSIGVPLIFPATLATG